MVDCLEEFRCPVCGSHHIEHGESYYYEQGIRYPNDHWYFCTECIWDSRDDDPFYYPPDDDIPF